MHVEFPKLTPEAEAAFNAALPSIDSICVFDWRRALSAFLRETLKQATERNHIFPAWEILAIANNLHALPPPPPPPPPTLAEAYAADLDTPEGKAKVRVFLELYLNDSSKLVQP